jgi:hypothetical protein
MYIRVSICMHACMYTLNMCVYMFVVMYVYAYIYIMMHMTIARQRPSNNSRISIVRQRVARHVSAKTDKHTIMDELLEVVTSIRSFLKLLMGHT